MREVDAQGASGQTSQAMGVQHLHLNDLGLAVRLQWLFSAIAHKFSSSVCIVQAWLPAQASGGEFTLHSEPRVAVLSDARLSQFRLRSCHTPVQFKNSMTGRVWRTGAVQVVQNLRLVPPTMHPRIYLADPDLDFLGEALYIPVYDSNRPGVGPMTVLEALLPMHCQEPICSADLLSFISAGLATLKLSVSNPAPQPIRRSALCGRRARAAADSAPDLQQAGPSEVAVAGPPVADILGPAGVAGAQPVVVAVGPVIKTISGPETQSTRRRGVVEEDTAGQLGAGPEAAGHGKPPVSCTSSLEGVADQHSMRSAADEDARPLAHRHSDARSAPEAGGCSTANDVPLIPASTPASAQGLAESGTSDGGSMALEEWDHMPRKVRKLQDGGHGKGMVRSQSSFQITAPHAAAQRDLSQR